MAARGRINRLRAGIDAEPDGVETVRAIHHLADDLGPGVEQTGDNGRVFGRHIAFHNAGTVQHGNAGNAHMILQPDRLAGQPAVGRAGDGAAPRPAVVPVVLGRRPRSEIPARILDRNGGRNQFVKTPVGRQHLADILRKAVNLFVMHVKTETPTSVAQILRGGHTHRHGQPPFFAGSYGTPSRECK